MGDSQVTVKASNAGICVRNTWLLEGVSFDCYEGEWTLVYGPSGSGKSTLLRAINGLCQPTLGYIRTQQTRIPGRSRRDARAVMRQTGTVSRKWRCSRQRVQLITWFLGCVPPDLTASPRVFTRPNG